MGNPLNRTAVAYPSQVYAKTPDVVKLRNPFGPGAIFDIDITALDAGVTITVTIERLDPVSQVPTTILASAALNATGHTVLKVYPALTASANTVVNDVLPAEYRIKSVHGGSAGNATYSIGVSYIL